MKRADDRRVDGTRAKSLSDVVAGLRFGLAAGLRVLFRRNPRPWAIPRGVIRYENPESQAPASVLTSERPCIGTLGETGPAISGHPPEQRISSATESTVISYKSESVAAACPESFCISETSQPVSLTHDSPWDDSSGRGSEAAPLFSATPSVDAHLLQTTPVDREVSQVDNFSEPEVSDVPDDIAETAATNLLGDIRELPAESRAETINASPEETLDGHITAEARLPSPDSQTFQAEQSDEGGFDSAPQLAPNASLPPSAEATRERSPIRPTINRPKPAESSQVYASAVLSHLPPEYLRWNRWIAEFSVTGVRRDDDVYISFTPTILTSIAEDFGDSSADPANAESDFVAVVGEAYRRIISQDGRLRVLRAIDREGTPLCLAFLAASVLAAYRMQSDEEVSGGAYYFRLAELLGCDMVAGHPRGFDSAVFESLWIFLEKWLADGRGAQLAMPNPETGVRRFVALPLTVRPSGADRQWREEPPM